jgi:hypothetical protein
VSVRYPAAWPAVAAAINERPAQVAVLPADSMRRFAWAGAPVLDPLPRWLRADVLATGDLTISGQPVPGEGRHARDVQALLLSGADPSALTEVGWIVVEHRTPGDMGSAATTLARLPVAYHDADLTLYRVGEAAGSPSDRRWVVIAAHVAWLAMLAAGGLLVARCTAVRQAVVMPES